MWEQPPFVGRGDERAALAAALADSACHAAFVVGTAGVGKTRLLREAAGAAADAGWATHWVTASPTSAAIPFGALVQALPTLEGADGFQLLREATRLIGEAAARGPVVIFIDDARYLDAASTAVAVHIALLGQAFVVTSWRWGATEDAVPGLAWRDVPARWVEVAPLDRDETGQLVASLLDGVTEATVAPLYRLSQGNPLFVTELVRGGRRGGHLRHDGRQWQWREGCEFTPRLRDVIGGRLDGAPEAVRAVVDFLSYAEPLPTMVLNELGVDVADLLTAERAGLIRSMSSDRGVEVALAHPLYGELARSRMSSLGRRELARRLYAAVEAGCDVDSLRAASWLLDSELATSSGALTVAARRAFAAFDLPLGLRLARAAVDRGDIDARVVLAELLIQSGDCKEADALLSALVGEIPATDATAGHARLCAAHAWNLTHGLRNPARAEAVLRGSGERIPQYPDVFAAARAHLAAYAGRPAEGLAQTDVVLSSDRADPLSVIQAWISRSFCLIMAGRPDAAFECAQVGSEKYTSLLGQAWSLLDEERHGGLAIASIFDGHLDVAADVCRRRLELTTLANSSSRMAAWSVLMSMIELYRGDVVAARARLQTVEALDGGATHPYAPWTRQLHMRVFALATAQAGLVDEAAAAVDRIEEPPTWIAAADLWSGSPRAWVIAAQGSTLQATHVAMADADRASDEGRHGWAVIALHQGVRFGHPALVAERLAAMDEVVSGDLPRLYLAHGSAAAARDGSRLREVATGYAELGMRLLQAETLAQSASAYGALGRGREAAVARAEATVLAASCEGAHTPMLATLGRVDALTAREREIARLAWSGKSSREIARRLTISIRTVDNTLGHAYRKLGVDGRQSLGNYFGRPAGRP